MTDTTLDKSAVKQRLYTHCLDYVTHHIEINQRMVDESQEAANEETKNTSGDRYETERAMKQRETELFGKRIEEALQLRATLMSINADRQCTIVQPGALVFTTAGIFFIAISSDEIIIDGEEYCMISVDSPIGAAMAGKRAGESFTFRGKKFSIEHIC